MGGWLEEEKHQNPIRSSFVVLRPVRTSHTHNWVSNGPHKSPLREWEWMSGEAKGAHLLDGRAGSAEAEGGLERVIDPPLEAREGTDHDDTGAKAAPHAHGSELRQNLAGRLVALAHLRDHLQNSEERAQVYSVHACSSAPSKHYDMRVPKTAF